ncbi:hypothetical protein HanPSC8_Chr01g0008601 [Helianthus annuus]|nr:hypothetical protein HanPSC8_Chr01g0008601 [Helianthus annuus]
MFKVNLFVWSEVEDMIPMIPTKAALAYRRMMLQNFNCPFCDNVRDEVNDKLLSCSHSSGVGR